MVFTIFGGTGASFGTGPHPVHLQAGDRELPDLGYTATAADAQERHARGVAWREGRGGNH